MFAENLKQLRKAKGLTQTQFASVFNISAGTIAMCGMLYFKYSRQWH